MKIFLQVLSLWLAIEGVTLPGGQGGSTRGYLGFDRNDYPGDAAMVELRKQFVFAGYWLTPPPGGKSNSWTGKRKLLQELKYGFSLLARGREGSVVKNRTNGQLYGLADAREAARSAKAEGFRRGAIIFLDVEEGGRLTPAYHAYLRRWADELVKLGFRPGVYCSGMVVNEGGATIVTADDIRMNEAPRKFAYWVFNDACPPSPGCVSVTDPQLPPSNGATDAAVWQFVRSPREKETASRCGGYAPDENCYATADAGKKWHLDMNIAAAANPSFPRAK